MGNKRRTLAVIMGVFLFAFGIISGAFLAFSNWTKTNEPIGNAMTPTLGSTTLQEVVKGSSLNSDSYGYLEAKAGHIYYIEIAGQDGYSASGGHGYGAVVYGFYYATANKTLTARVGVSGGNASKGWTRQGGGYSSFETFNIAIPGTSTAYQDQIYTSRSYFAVAGGGGARGDNGYGGNAGWAQGETGKTSKSTLGWPTYGELSRGDGGGGATQTSGGYGGGCYGYYENNRPGKAGSYLKGGESTEAGAGGGGAGYYGGGGAGRGQYGNNDDQGGGGGGSSSPYTYGLYVNDASNSKSTGTGYVKVMDLTPATEPAGQTVKVGQQAKVTPGSLPTFANVDLLKSQITFEWRYAPIGSSSWTSTAPTKTTYGSVTYVCQLLMKCKSDSDFPTKNMPLQTVIYTKNVTLTCEANAGICNAPMLTTTRNYIGEVYTNIIQSPGSTHQGGQFKYLITTTAKYYEGKAADKSLSWQTDVSKSSTILRGGTTYYIYYYATAPTDNSYTETTVKVSTLTVSKTTLSGNNIGVGTIEPQAGQVFNNETKSLFNGMLTCQIGSTSIKDQVEVYWAI